MSRTPAASSFLGNRQRRQPRACPAHLSGRCSAAPGRCPGVTSSIRIVDARGQVGRRAEDDRPAAVAHQVGRDGGLLDHRAIRGQVAAQNRDAALRTERLLERKDDPLRSAPARAAGGVLPQRRHAFELLADGPAGDRRLVEVQQSAPRQLLHDRRDAARVEQLLHVKRAARPQIGDERRLARHAVEQVERQVDPRRPAMAVRWITALVEPPRAIISRIAFSNARCREDVAGSNAGADGGDDLPTGRLGQAETASVRGGDGGVAGQRHAERLSHGCHRRGGAHDRAVAVASD